MPAIDLLKSYLQQSNGPAPDPSGTGDTDTAQPGDQVAAFARAYAPAAQRAGSALGVDPSVLLAQWGEETGWGRSVVPGTNNLGNIKDFSGGGVAATDNQTGTNDNYQAFADPGAFADHYASLIQRKYPGAVGAGSDAAGYYGALKAGGYAQDKDYASKLQAAHATLLAHTGQPPAATPAASQAQPGSQAPADPFAAILAAGMAAKVPTPPAEQGSDFTRGVKASFQQLPQLGYGLLAGAGAAGESAFGEGGIASGMKKAGIAGYKDWGDTIQKDAKPSDSFTYSWDQAKQGNFGALADWLAYGIGYSGGQGAQMLATGGLGSIVGKGTATAVAEKVAAGLVAKETARLTEGLVAQESARIAATSAGAQMSADQLARQAAAIVAARGSTAELTKQATANVAAHLGQTAAIGANAFGMEGGEIFGDLTSSNPDQPLTGEQLAKAFGATLAAGGLEFVGDKVGLEVMLGKSALMKPAEHMTGIAGRAARAGLGIAGGAPTEAATEYGQTMLEEYGKGNDPFSDATRTQAIDAAGLGAVGGVTHGVVGGAMSSPQAAPTPTGFGTGTTAQTTPGQTAAGTPAVPGAPAAPALPAAPPPLPANAGPLARANHAAATAAAATAQTAATQPGAAAPLSPGLNPNVAEAAQLQRRDDASAAFGSEDPAAVRATKQAEVQRQVDTANAPLRTTFDPLDAGNAQAADAAQAAQGDPADALAADIAAQHAQEQAALAQQQQQAAAQRAAEQEQAAQQAAAAQADYLHKQSLQRQAELDAIHGRVEAHQAMQSKNARMGILDQVLTDKADASPAAKLRAFSDRLGREGYRNIAPTDDEIAHVQRHADIATALAAPDLLPSAPNELTDAVPERTTAAPAPAGTNTAAVDAAIAAGMRLKTASGNLLHKKGSTRVFKLSTAQKAHYLARMAALEGGQAAPTAGVPHALPATTERGHGLPAGEPDAQPGPAVAPVQPGADVAVPAVDGKAVPAALNGKPAHPAATTRENTNGLHAADAGGRHDGLAGAETAAQERRGQPRAGEADQAPGADSAGVPAGPAAAAGSGVPGADQAAHGQPALNEEGEPAAAHVGHQIDKDWTAFAPDSGTLGIPRADMPQIKAEHRGALTQFLKARGIDHEQETDVLPSTLKPTQREFSHAKVEQAQHHQGGDRAILVSSDNHILDGHHQWLANLEDDKPIRVIRFDAPIHQLIAEAKEFPSAEVADGATQAEEKAPDTAARDAIAARYAALLAEGKSHRADANEFHQRFADDILAKNAFRLKWIVNGMNDKAKKVFAEATGVKLPKAQGAAWEALKAWAGVTKEQDDAQNARDAAARAEKAQAQDDQWAEQQASNKKFRTSAEDGTLVSGKEVVDRQIGEGFTEIANISKGPVPKYALVNRTTQRYYPLDKIAKAYAEVALRRLGNAAKVAQADTDHLQTNEQAAAEAADHERELADAKAKGQTVASDDDVAHLFGKKPAPATEASTPAAPQEAAAPVAHNGTPEAAGGAMAKEDQKDSTEAARRLGSLYRNWVAKDDHRISAHPDDETLAKYAKWGQDILDGKSPLSKAEDFERYIRLSEYGRKHGFDLATINRAYENGQDIAPDGTLAKRAGVATPAPAAENAAQPDVLNHVGKPFTMKFGAEKALKDQGLSATHEVVKTPDGYVGRVKQAATEQQESAHEAAPVGKNADLYDGTIIRDAKGQQYRVHSMRNSLIRAHPIVDGKPQVSRDTTVRFWTDSETPPAGEHDRTDPVYVVGNDQRSAPQPAPAEQVPAPTQAVDPIDAELQDALGHLGDVLGDVFGAKLNMTGKQHGAGDLLPALSKVIELLVRKGFRSFSAAVGASAKAMRGNPAVAEHLDKVSARQWKAAYNAVAEFHEGTDSEDAVAAMPAEQVLQLVAPTSAFGPRFTQFHHDAQGAVAKLMQEQTGEAIGALHHPAVGDIDLVWGEAGTRESDGYGLAKIAKYHPEVLADLQGFISTLTKNDAKSGPNRVRLESPDGVAVVRLDWEQAQKQWLLTAFEKNGKGSDRGTTTDTAPFSSLDDTARQTATPGDSVANEPANVNTATAPASPVHLEGSPEYAALDQRAKANDAKVDALSDDQVRAMYAAMNLAGATQSVDKLRETIKAEHPDDVEAGLAAIAPQTDAAAPAPLPPMAEGDRIRFEPYDTSLAKPVEGMAVQIDKTSSGNLRIKISTDEPAPQGGGNISRVVYSNDGAITNLSAAQDAEIAKTATSPADRFEQLRAKGDGSEMAAITALRKIAGRSDDTDITFWNRWRDVMGSNEIKWRSGAEVIKWMENGLVQQPWTGRALPGGDVRETSAQVPADYWRSSLVEFDRRDKDFNASTERWEQQARDVEEMGGSAEAVAKARAVIGAMKQETVKNRRAIEDGLKAAAAREKTEQATEEAAEAARYKPADLKELAKKPTTASIHNWFGATYEGGDVWTEGHMVDLTGEPHLSGWRDRMDPLRKDGRKMDVARVLPKKKGELLQPFGVYDQKTGAATGTVFFEYADRVADDKRAAVGIARQYVQYFMSKYKGAEFWAEPDEKGQPSIGVYHDGKIVGVVMPFRLAGLKESPPTVGEIKAKIAGGDAQRATDAATAAAQPPAPLTDRDHLREQLKGAKFVKGQVTIKAHNGTETTVDGYTYRGMGVHQIGKSTSKNYRITHLNTGLSIGPDYPTMTDAKLAAARMGAVADLDEVKTEADARRDGQDPSTGFGKVARLVKAMRAGNSTGYGDPLAEPELSLHPEMAASEATPAPQETAAPDTRAAFEHDGTKIYPITFQGEPRWAVQTLENKGTDHVFGDNIFDNVEDAKKQAERANLDAASKAQREAEAQRAAEAEEARKEANRGKNVTERRADAVLDKPARLPREAGLGTGTRREAMDKAVEQDRAIVEKMVDDSAAKKRDEEAIAAMSRAGYLIDHSNENIPLVKAAREARERLTADNYKKPAYRVYDGSTTDGGFYEISKTEYDYAKGLMEKATASAAAAADTASAAPQDEAEPAAAADEALPTNTAATVTESTDTPDTRPPEPTKPYQVVSPDEYPTKDAAASYSGISHSGGGRAVMDRDSFVNTVQELYDHALVEAETDEQKMALRIAIDEFKAGYLRQTASLIKVRSGTYSAFVAGRSGLNSKQANSRNSALDKALDRFAQWEKEAAPKVMQAVLDARSEDQLAEIQHAKDEKAATRQAKDDAFLRKLLDFKAGGEPLTIGNATLARVSYGKDGLPSSLTMTGADLIKGVNDKFNVVPMLYKTKELLAAAVERVRAADAAPEADTQSANSAVEAAGFTVVGTSALGGEFPNGKKLEVSQPGSRTIGQIRQYDTAKNTFQGFANNSHSAPDMPLPAVIQWLKDWYKHEDTSGAPAQDAATTAIPPLGHVNLAEHARTMQALEDGELPLAAYKADYQRTLDSEAQIKAELGTKKKDALLAQGGGHFAYQYKNDTKERIVNALYEHMLMDYVLNTDGVFSYGMDGPRPAIAKHVAAMTADGIQAYVVAQRLALREQEAKAKARSAGMADPQTLADFGALMKEKVEGGMTFKEARLSLTPEQRAKYDDLRATLSRAERAERKVEKQEQTMRAPGETLTASETFKTRHMKHGHDLWQFQLDQRVSNDEFQDLVAKARQLGGDYNKYQGNGATRGWQFKTPEGAAAFKALLAGDASAAKDVMAARRDAFADDKSQSAAERLNEMADRLEQGAADSEAVDRKSNTARRARFAAAADAAARGSRALATTMRNIAGAIASGKAKFLDRVRTRTQIDQINSTLSVAQYNALKAKYGDRFDFEKHRYDPITIEAADHAEWPSYTAFRSDLAALGRQLLDTEGTKKLGQRVMKVADDVSSAYLAFAKDNFHQVATFSNSKTGERATFTSEHDAELAIARSGYRGKAIAYKVKAREYAIVMSPSEAIERGIWKGDGDKRITLSPEFGTELVEKLGKLNRRNRGRDSVPSAPWQFDSAHDQLAKWARMGIETPAEMRAALREYIALREAPKEADKVKELERGMVGRKNDGLDFFPTPEGQAEEMIAAADLKPGMAVLEPSAGMGHIADRLRENGVEPDVVEMANDRRELLEAKGYDLVGHDFMDLNGDKQYDRIIMNPPFSSRRDAEHVQHAYDLLKPGGRLVAIMGEGVFFGQDKKAQAFRDWLDAHGGTSEKLAEGTFMDPSLPVNTSVNARMVVVDKPAAHDAATDAPAKDTDDALMGSLAYHGTPHHFDQFTMDHMGSGEGAQTYGWGLYFAGEKQVAEHYREGLTPAGGSGQLYTVDIPDDDQFLHLDKPLAEQPQHVKDALRAIADTLPDVGQVNRASARRDESPRMQLHRAINIPDDAHTGRWAYNLIAQQQGNGSWQDDRAASLLLNQHGVPGAMYADQLSRGRPGQTFNYVLYDAASVAIVDRAHAAAMGSQHAAAASDLDQSLHDAARSGATAADLLHTIASESTDPAHRALAEQLLANGVNPTVGTGSADGQTFATGRDAQDYAASYDPKAHHVALYDAGGAERNLLHEFIHAATAQALRAGGKAALQMKALYAAAKRSGLLADHYGMANLDEFVAEAHSNPAFQQALQQVGGERSLWDRFVDIVRSVLGLQPAQRDMLSQVLAAGRGLMAENAGSTDAAGMGNIAQTATKAFKDWFGGSKVTKPDGTPRVVYHGTAGNFDAFDGAKSSTASMHATAYLGHYFSESPDVASDFVPQHQDQSSWPWKTGPKQGGSVLPVYLSISKPYEMPLAEFRAMVPSGRSKAGLQEARALRARLVAEGYDGIHVAGDPSLKDTMGGDEWSAPTWIAFEPSQIKSATGNSGAFDPANPSIMGNIRTDLGTALANAATSTKEINLWAGYKVGDFLDKTGKVGWWHKTIGTMKNLALKHPAFRPVYEAVQNFLGDVSRYATAAGDLAPRLMPQLETLADINPFSKNRKKAVSAEDTRAIAKPIFDGTKEWARDAHGKPVLVTDLRTQAEALSPDQKAQILLQKGVIDDQQYKAWRALPPDTHDAAVENRFEATQLQPGVVWTDAELRGMFNLNDSQIGLYHEFRAAVDKSITNLTISEMTRIAGKPDPALVAQAVAMPDLQSAAELLRDHYVALARMVPDMADMHVATATQIMNKADHGQKLIDRGYAPLQRFGPYTVYMQEDGEPPYFGMYETSADAAQAARSMKESYPAAFIRQGTMSQEEYKLFANVSPESMELFGSMLGLGGDANAADKAYQKYIQLTKANHSALKRMMHRKGTDGYSEDVGRVLASFLYSNARLTSSNFHTGEIDEGVNEIPKEQGQLKDQAIALRQHVRDPQSGGTFLSALMFAQYLGGSVASAAVNFTQPIMTSLPYLSQWGGVGKAGSRLLAAVRDARKDSTGDAALDAALEQHKDVVSPQEVHYMQAQAAGKATLRAGDGTKAGDLRADAYNRWAAVRVAWGKMFSWAEQSNRRITFIAAYRTAVEQGNLGDPGKFAAQVVKDTQFVANAGNKMAWGRNPVGGLLLTFKGFSIQYLEMLGKMAFAGAPGSPERAAGRRAVLYAMAVMLMMAGSRGIPFEQDLEDAIDGLMQRLGYNFSSKRALQAFLANKLGDGFADFAMTGASGLPGMPFDMAGRLGAGNLIPGTGLLTKKQSYTSDVGELVGPAGDMAKRAFTATGKALGGDIAGAALDMSPQAVRNLVQGIDMLRTGTYRDARGYIVNHTTPVEAGMKALGFQPNSTANVQDAKGQALNMIAQARMRSNEIAERWAQGRANNDEAMVADARAMRDDWNRKNPDTPVQVSMPGVMHRARAMREDALARTQKTAGKALKQAVRRELSEVRE